MPMTLAMILPILNAEDPVVPGSTDSVAVEAVCLLLEGEDESGSYVEPIPWDFDGPLLAVITPPEAVESKMGVVRGLEIPGASSVTCCVIVAPETGI